jgi:hypothetical protein
MVWALGFTVWGLSFNVTTLALGSQPRQGLARVWDKKEAQKAHLILARMYESVRE